MAELTSSIYTPAPQATYTPASIIECYNNALKVNVENTPVLIQGIYQPDSSNRLYGDYYYDKLIEEGGKEILTLKVKPVHRTKILAEKGKLVTVSGTLSRKVTSNSRIDVFVSLTFILTSQKSAISQDEIKLAELAVKKSRKGFKSVGLLIKQAIFESRKPRVALLFSPHSVVRTEFGNACGNAVQAIDFSIVNTTFANVKETVGILQNIDKEYDIIALIRGGGSCLEVFSDPVLIEAIVNMSTPVISAVGHAEEKHYLKNVADLTVDTPTALGKFFSDTVEEVVTARVKSKAALTLEVRKSFEEMLEKQTAQIKSQGEQNAKLIQQIDNQRKQFDKITELNQKKNTETGNHIEELTKQLKAERDSRVSSEKDASNHISKLTNQLQEAAQNTGKQTDAINTLTVQMQKLSSEAENYKTVLESKEKELILKCREIATISACPQGMTIVKVAVIATIAFATGLCLALLI